MHGKSRWNGKNFFQCMAGAVRMARNFFKRTARAIQMARIFWNARQDPFEQQEFFQTPGKSRSNGSPIRSNG